MRHRKAGRKLGRNSSHRKAVLRNLVTSLLKYEQVETTHAKAKEVTPLAEKMITLAKRGDLHARRQAMEFIQDKNVTHKLFEESKDRFIERQGGYTRIIKKGYRKGDGAPVAVVQLVIEDEGKKKDKKKKKASKPDKKTTQKIKKEIEEKTVNSDEQKGEEGPQRSSEKEDE